MASKELIVLLSKSIAELEPRGFRFALAGGLVANLYRRTERATVDVDIAVYTEVGALELAKEVVLALGLTPAEVTRAEFEGGPLFAIKSRSAPVRIVVGRIPGATIAKGVDLILPEMSWVSEAIEGARGNLMDVGLGKPIPVLTREDFIISKLFSSRDKNKRHKDLDDLKDILSQGQAREKYRHASFTV